MTSSILKGLVTNYGNYSIDRLRKTVRRLGDRFREHLHDVEKDDKTHLNRSRDT